jgi:Putative adhesin
MSSWTVDRPTSLDFDEVTAVNVRLVGGTVAVLATDDRPSLVVTELKGRPLQVSHEGGTLTISYESLSWDGLLSFLKPRHDATAVTVTVTVPADCPIQLGVLSASAIVSGLSAGASVRGLSGDITLDGVTGDVTAETMSGEVAACDIDGAVRFKSVSGALTLAGGALDSLEANTLSGQVTADVTLTAAASVTISTMSGDVTLRLPSDSDASVRLQSTSGAVHSEFDSLRTVKAPASRVASGNVGAGTGQVSVSTMSGSVTLLRRSAAEMESKTR